MAQVRLSFTDAERRQFIPYEMLAECENKLNTGKAKRLMAELGITPEKLAKYQKQARSWYLIKPPTADQSWTAEEIEDWGRIGQLASML